MAEGVGHGAECYGPFLPVIQQTLASAGPEIFVPVTLRNVAYSRSTSPRQIFVFFIRCIHSLSLLCYYRDEFSFPHQCPRPDGMKFLVTVFGFANLVIKSLGTAFLWVGRHPSPFPRPNAHPIAKATSKWGRGWGFCEPGPPPPRCSCRSSHRYALCKLTLLRGLTSWARPEFYIFCYARKPGHSLVWNDVAVGPAAP